MASMNNNNPNEADLKFIAFNVLKDGRIVLNNPHFMGEKIPPTDDLTNGVRIKDVRISPDVSARVFLPRDTSTSTRTSPRNQLPLLLYIHGGAFCMESAYSVVYTRYVSNLVAQANVIAVSVEYSLFPKRPLPACYEESWAALLWVAAHGNGHGLDPWINDYADLQRTFVAGDSAGGNICHTLLARVGSRGLPKGVNIEGMILAHPYFGLNKRDEDAWLYSCPTNEGRSDRRLKPNQEDLARIGCGRVLVMVATKDPLIVVGKKYVEDLIRSGWKGRVEIVENKDKGHCFHIYNPKDLESIANTSRITSFIHHRPRSDAEYKRYPQRHLVSSL